MERFGLALFLLRQSYEEDKKKYEAACLRKGRKFEYYKDGMERSANEIEELQTIVEQLESGMLTVEK